MAQIDLYTDELLEFLLNGNLFKRFSIRKSYTPDFAYNVIADEFIESLDSRDFLPGKIAYMFFRYPADHLITLGETTYLLERLKSMPFKDVVWGCDYLDSDFYQINLIAEISTNKNL